MTAFTTDDRGPVATVPLRVLVAVHGFEPPAWIEETCRVVSTWTRPTVRALAVLDVPGAPFTSLTSPAGRAYRAARAEWARIERVRLDASIRALVSGLPAGAEVSTVLPPRGDLAHAIADDAREWRADVVVVGAPAPGPWSWLRPGPVHQRVLRLAAATVLVTVPPHGARRGWRRPGALPHPALATAGDRA